MRFMYKSDWLNSAFDLLTRSGITAIPDSACRIMCNDELIRADVNNIHTIGIYTIEPRAHKSTQPCSKAEKPELQLFVKMNLLDIDMGTSKPTLE